jgi:hypothetical protein
MRPNSTFPPSQSCFFAIMGALLGFASTLGAATYYVPVIARGPGAQGSFTETDLWMVAPVGGSAVTANLRLFKSGAGTGSNPDQGSKVVTIPAGGSLRYADAMKSLFGVEHGVGAVQIDATGELSVGSRTYDAAGTGTFGELVVGQTDDDVLHPGDTGYFHLAGKSSAVRTNVGVMNLGSSTLTFNVAVKSLTGGLLGLGAFQVPGHGHLQVNDIFAQTFALPADRARVELNGDQPFLAYSAYVDNGTNDPTIEIARRGSEAARELLLPVAAHAEGANGSHFRSDLRVTNPNVYPVVVDLTFFPRGGTPVSSETAFLRPGQTTSFEDLVVESFRLAGAVGPVRVSASGPVLAFSRLYNTTFAGTSGQGIPVLAHAASIYPGAPVELAGLEKSEETRSNVGFVNTSDRDVRFTAKLVGPEGEPLATRELILTPGGFEQWNDVFGLLGVPAGVASLRVETRPVTAATAANPETAGAFVYGSLVDNRTGDPSFLPFRFLRPATGHAVIAFQASPDTVCGLVSTEAEWEVAGNATAVTLSSSAGDTSVPLSASTSVFPPASGTLKLVSTGPSGVIAVRQDVAVDGMPSVDRFEVVQTQPICPYSPLKIRYETTNASAVYLTDGSALVQALPPASPSAGTDILVQTEENLELVAISSCGSSSKTAKADILDGGLRSISVRADPSTLYYYRWGQSTVGCCVVKYKPLTSTILYTITNPGKAKIVSIETTAMYGTIKDHSQPGGGGGNTFTLDYVGPAEWVTDTITVTATDECGNSVTGQTTIAINVCLPPEGQIGCACPQWCDSRGTNPSVPWYHCPDDSFGWCTHTAPAGATSCPYCFDQVWYLNNPPTGYSCNDPQY